jgi:hypothetical protein
MKINSEILLYIQKVKLYLESNEEARKYFHIDLFGGTMFQDMFYTMLEEMAKKNYEEKNDPILSVAQFEDIRSKLVSFALEEYLESKYVFEKLTQIKIPELSKICLN